MDKIYEQKWLYSISFFIKTHSWDIRKGKSHRPLWVLYALKLLFVWANYMLSMKYTLAETYLIFKFQSKVWE